MRTSKDSNAVSTIILILVSRYYQPRSYGLEFSALEAGPRVSPDKALTVMCQAAALRLNARRALISFFDHKSQYILAEATRSTCLQDGRSLEPNDDLWFGIACLSRQGSICAKVVEMPLMQEADKDVTVLIVNDLYNNEQYKGLDIVCKGSARFYAGVPITSPAGQVIGRRLS